jgi:hypothetical protein
MNPTEEETEIALRAVVDSPYLSYSEGGRTVERRYTWEQFHGTLEFLLEQARQGVERMRGVRR